MGNHTSDGYKLTDTEEFMQLMTASIPEYSNRPRNSKFKNFLLNNQTGLVPFDISPDVQEILCDNLTLKENEEESIGYGLYMTRPNSPSAFYLKKDFYTGVGKGANEPLLEEEVNKFFQGRKIELPRNSGLNPKYRSFEDFTSVNEEHHLSFWTTVALEYLSNEQSRVGKEIQLLESENSRDGRLDVCIINQGQLLILEAKISIQAAVSENRFRQRIGSYKSESLKTIKETLPNLLSKTVLLVGGSESALFNENHPDYRQNQYVLGKNFIDKCNDADISFVTANFLWCALMKSLVTGQKICWDAQIWDQLDLPDTLALTSAGALNRDGSVRALSF